MIAVAKETSSRQYVGRIIDDSQICPPPFGFLGKAVRVTLFRKSLEDLAAELRKYSKIPKFRDYFREIKGASIEGYEEQPASQDDVNKLNGLLIN